MKEARGTKTVGRYIAIFAMIVLTSIMVIGCDEGMQMVGPVMPEPTSPTEPTVPKPTEPEMLEPTTNGEMKESKPEMPEPTEPDPEPEKSEPEMPEPTITIETTQSEEGGSITIAGTSTDLPTGETVTITLGEALSVTTITDEEGAWSVTIAAKEVANLPAGTVTVRAVAGKTTAEGSLEHTPPAATPYGIVPATEAERIQIGIIADVGGGVSFSKSGYIGLMAEYGSLFDMETEVGRETFRRFVEYEKKKLALAISGNFHDSALLDQYFAEAYGISADYGRWLVHEVYLKEKPEDKKFLNRGWQKFDISMEYLLLQIANPDATEEDLLELLRESIRAGNVSIASS